jgi:3-keto-disaccharide hydrolase
MQRPTSILLLVCGLIASCSNNRVSAPDQTTSPDTANTLTSQERAGGWKLLFDGKTTTGWRAFGQKDVPAGWQAVDGALTRVGAGADIITTEQFDSFELAIEWKISDGGNSGIMYRVSEEGEATYHTGPEFQVLDNQKHRDGQDPLTSAGSCYGLYAPTKDVTRPVGSWNQARLIVNGNHVEHWMNGEKIVEYELLSPDWEKRVAASKFKEWPKYGRIPRGHIALQDHGDRVAYRNIKIRPLK